MFVIVLTYLRPLTEVDAQLGPHREFLERYYASGNFLLSGRREPRNGGVILAKAESLSEMELILSEDPFNQQGLALYEIIEFIPSLSADFLASLRQPQR